MDLLIGVVGSILAAIVCALVVHIYRRAKNWKTLASASSATSKVSAAVAIFGGRVQVVTEELLAHPASSGRVQQFFAGAKLDWDIIVANGDIPRDQQEDLLTLAIQPSEGMRLISVVGEAGAGKSTMAWRAAAELYRQYKIPIIHIKDPDEGNVWYRLPELYASLRRSFYVLVDDVFHDPHAATAFGELNPWLPITIIATSRRNEYHGASRLKCERLRFDLKPPSDGEKERILNRLGKSRTALTPDQQLRLNAADQFIVLMMELTEGKELGEIVRDSIERLRQLDNAAHRAYEYLCFAYQHSIETPVSLLERLDSQGHFHNLPDRETAQGLIFWSSRKDRARVGHAVIAETAATFYAQHRSPEIVLSEMTNAVNSANSGERLFLVRLLRVMAKSQLSIVKTVLEPLEGVFASCMRNAVSVSELTYWRTFYRLCGLYEMAETCVDLALTLEPVSALDCNLIHGMLRERGREQNALPIIEKWVKDHPEGRGATSYLGLIGDYGSVDDVETVLQETSTWLAQHPDENLVRTPYLKLVERKGSSEQVAQVIKETAKWLRAHSHDPSVRQVYLGLVERKGTAEDVTQALKNTRDWLALHDDDVEVRKAWLGFVEARGTNEVKEATIVESKVWLSQNPLAKEVWSAFVGWSFRAGRSEEAKDLALTAVSRHPNDQNLLEQYVRLVQQQDSADQQMVRNVSEELIAKYPKHLRAQVHYASWLRKHGYHDEAEERYRNLANAGERRIRMMANYGYGQLLLELVQFKESAVKFREVLKIHKGHQMAHDGLAFALWKLGDFDGAEKEFRSAIYWAGINGQPEAKFNTDLGCFYIDRQLWQDALRSFELARDEDPDYFGNYWGIGKALIKVGKYEPAAEALRTAIRKQPNLEPPAGDDIPELLRQCLEQFNKK